MAAVISQAYDRTMGSRNLIGRIAGLTLGTGLLVALAAIPSAQTSKPLTGEQIFRGQCALCHGAKGEGTKKYAKALTGSRSIGQLAEFIQKSMPPGAKQKLSSADAAKVAAYIYESFYSPIAQARNRPARVELSRLTVRQYRNAVTDLIGSFRM